MATTSKPSASTGDSFSSNESPDDAGRPPSYLGVRTFGEFCREADVGIGESEEGGTSMAEATGIPRPTEYWLFDTAIGWCGIAWTETGVARLQLPERDSGATERRLVRGSASAASGLPPTAARAVELVRLYLGGRRVDFSPVTLDLTGVNAFHRKMYDVARSVGFGQTATYGEIADRAGSPGAARGVGQAMSRNPVPIIIPCHRILAAGNRIGGFSAFGGTSTKQRLLALEGVRTDTPQPVRKSAGPGQLDLFGSGGGRRVS
jgi:methylated-DNA-[protein]-cysteine S-methyltransferase